MSHLKVPSWFELIEPPDRTQGLSLDTSPEDLFWKEHSLRFGFDIRKQKAHTAPIKNPWKSFFFEKFLEYTLQKVNWNLDDIKTWEKNFWKQNGQHIEKLELHAPYITIKDFEQVLQWLPNLKVLTLSKCNLLMQATTDELLPQNIPLLPELHTLIIQDLHLLSSKIIKYIPTQINTLVIDHCRSLCPEFIENLSSLKQLISLTLRACPTVELNQLSKVPSQLRELDLTGSGKFFQAESLALLPHELQVLKLNGWDGCSDNELRYVPLHIETLEIEGWSITKEGLSMLENRPLKHLNLSGCARDTFYSSLFLLPKTLQSLNLSQNDLLAEDLFMLDSLEQLQSLTIEYGNAYGAKLDDLPIRFPSKLHKLLLSHSGPFTKKTIESLKRLTELKTLSLAGCEIENSDLEWLPESLEELDLSLCHQINDSGLTFLANHYNLSSLTLDGCEQMRGSGFSSLTPSLKKLSLKGCNRLSGKSFVALPSEIEELFLDHCSLISTDDIYALPSTLQVLTLAECTNITDEVIRFLSTFPLLHTVCLQGCQGTNENSIAQFFRCKFEGTITVDSSIESHPPVAMLKKLTNFKAKIIQRIKSQLFYHPKESK